jgi:ATP-dependent Clp protease ATP-binding subunit ClpB
LPDKAIDLIDEAASRLRIEIDSMPIEIDEVERKIMQLEIERQALKREQDKASMGRLAHLEQEIHNLKETSSGSKPIGRMKKRRFNSCARSKKKSKRPKSRNRKPNGRQFEQSRRTALRHLDATG